MLGQNLALTVHIGDFNFIKQSLRSHNNLKRHSAVQMLWGHRVLFKKSTVISTFIVVPVCFDKV